MSYSCNIANIISLIWIYVILLGFSTMGDVFPKFAVSKSVEKLRPISQNAMAVLRSLVSFSNIFHIFSVVPPPTVDSKLDNLLLFSLSKLSILQNMYILQIICIFAYLSNSNIYWLYLHIWCLCFDKNIFECFNLLIKLPIGSS